MIKILTTKQIQNEGTYIILNSDGKIPIISFSEFLKQEWVLKKDILDRINNLRKSNDMWRYDVDTCFSMLEDELKGGGQ